MNVNALKQCVGVDCAKLELVATLSVFESTLSTRIVGRKKVENNIKGIKKLHKWVTQNKVEGVAVQYVVEATGVYHQAMAVYFREEAEFVSVVLPNRISNYMKMQVLKTINDDTSADIIADFGLRHSLECWEIPDQELFDLRNLMRERHSLIVKRNQLKCQTEASQHRSRVNANEQKRLKKHIKFINKMIEDIEQEADELVKSNQSLKNSVKNLCSIPGVNTITTYIIIGETFGFDLFRSSRQLVSYAGLDVTTKESGTSVHKKPRISKKGNKHIRRALYMPGLSAAYHNRELSGVYARLVGMHGIKMKAAVAVQRKLLVLMYTLWKNNQPYKPDYEYLRKKSGHPSLGTPTKLADESTALESKITKKVLA